VRTEGGGKYDDLIAALAGGGAAAPEKDAPTPLGWAQRPGPISPRQAERGRGPITVGGTSASGRPGQYPISGRGFLGEGYTEEDINAILRGMPPERIAALQRNLQIAGLLPANYDGRGYVDGSTRQAFGQLLEMSNTRNASYEATLTSMVRGEVTATELRKQQAKRAAELSFGTATRVFEPSDPASLRQTAEAAFQQAIGRNATEEEAAKFTNAFLERERANQQARFAEMDRVDLDERQRALAAAGQAADPLGVSGAGGGLDSFMSAMSSQESGGNYNARNKRTGASGRFQIMPSNWGPWSKEAGLGPNAPRTPENQDKVARFKMQQYYDQFGSWDAVAVAWYAGPGAVKGYLSNPRASRYTRKQGKGNEPSINEYVASVMGKMSKLGGAPAKSASTGGSEADTLWANLQRMIADAPGKITPGKRTRSYEEQVRLYERYKSGKGPLAAKPGTSKHTDGRANDLKYENQATKRWALENAHRYGLAFPLLNHGEDWHIELAAGHSMNDGHDHGGAAPVSRTWTAPVQQDPTTAARDFARNANPAETRAFDLNGQFNTLLQLLTRRTGV
jgi:hypothetical protein